MPHNDRRRPTRPPHSTATTPARPSDAGFGRAILGLVPEELAGRSADLAALRAAIADHLRAAVEEERRGLRTTLRLCVQTFDQVLACPGVPGNLRAAVRACRGLCLAGLADPEAREQAPLAGCEAFLTKPVDVAALLDVAGRQVKRRREELSGLTKTQAEALLDWLETWGCSDLEGSYAGQSGFTVSWSWPEGRSLGIDQVRKIIEGP